MTEIRLDDEPVRGGIRPVRLLMTVLVLLALIFAASRWYAATVSIPRYCAQPEISLQRLAAVLTDHRPAGNGPRRDYVIAAKLGFLLPAKADESAADYLLRLRKHLERTCG